MQNKEDFIHAVLKVPIQHAEQNEDQLKEKVINLSQHQSLILKVFNQ